MGSRAVRTAFGLPEPMGLDPAALAYVKRAKQIEDAKSAQHGKMGKLGKASKVMAGVGSMLTPTPLAPVGLGLQAVGKAGMATDSALMAAGPSAQREEIKTGQTPWWGRTARMTPTTSISEPIATSDSPLRGAGLSGLEALKAGLSGVGGPIGAGFYGAHKLNQNFQPNDEARRLTGYGLMAAQAGLDTAGLLPPVAAGGEGLQQIAQFPFGGIPQAAGGGAGATALNFMGNTLKQGPTAANVSGEVMQRLEQMAKDRLYMKFGPGRLKKGGPSVGLFGGFGALPTMSGG